MSHTVSAAVTGLLIFAATIWIGGLFTIAVVARVASRTLAPAARVQFFRGLGRAYGIVGTTSLVIAYGTGASLAYGRQWNGLLTATAVVAAALAVSLAIGVVQAQRMTRLRRRALDQVDDPELSARVRRGAGRAGALRALLAVFSLTLLALGVVIGT